MDLPGSASREAFLAESSPAACLPAPPIVEGLQALEAFVVALFEARSHFRTIDHTGTLGIDGPVLLPGIQQLVTSICRLVFWPRWSCWFWVPSRRRCRFAGRKSG